MFDTAPAEWSTRPLGSLIDFVNGYPFEPDDWASDGTPIIRIQNLNGSKDFNYYQGEIPPRFHVRAGNLLFCWSGSRGTSFGPRKWNGPLGFLNQHIFRCILSDDVDADYAYFLLQGMTASIEAEAHGGGGLVHIKKSELVRFEAKIPSLAEQRRIAEVLRSVDAAIAAQSEVCGQLEVTFSSLAEACFTAGDEAENVWPILPLGELCESIQVGIVVRPASYYVKIGGIPALRSLNVGENRLDLDDLVYISVEGHRLNSKSSLRPGDVVTRRTGEPGKTAVIPPRFPEGLNCIDIIFSRPKAQLRADFLSFFMNSNAAKRQVTGLQGGLAQQHLNVGEMKKLKVPVPIPMVQDEVIETLKSAWDRVEG